MKMSGNINLILSRMLGFTLACGLIITIGLGMACERATSLKFEGGNPPKFLMTGSGSLGLLRIRGPEKQRDATGETAFLYWVIKPINIDSVRSVEKMGSITYGQVPPGYKQVYPEKGEAPQLAEGRIYNVHIDAFNAPGVIKRFSIRDGKVAEAP